MRVRILVGHYRDGEFVKGGEIVEMPDNEARELLAMRYVEIVRKNAKLSRGESAPNESYEAGVDRMIRTKGA